MRETTGRRQLRAATLPEWCLGSQGPGLVGCSSGFDPFQRRRFCVFFEVDNLYPLTKNYSLGIVEIKVL